MSDTKTTAGAAPANTTGAIAKARQTKPATPKATMNAYITRMQGEIAKALPSVITPERFTRIVTSALSSSPQLAETTPRGFLGAVMTAAQLGMDLGGVAVRKLPPQ